MTFSSEQRLLGDTFSDFFTQHAPPTRVRAAEPIGFDKAFWARLLNTGGVAMTPPAAGGDAS